MVMKATRGVRVDSSTAACGERRRDERERERERERGRRGETDAHRDTKKNENRLA